MSINVEMCNPNLNIFPGSMCFNFPQSEAVAPTPYTEGTYLLNLSGPGASTVTNDELSEHLKKKKQLNFPFKIVQSDSALSRLFVAAPDIPSLHNLQSNFVSKNKQSVKLQLCHPKKQSITFCVDWVPMTVPESCVKQLISSFCDIERVSQDTNPTRYYIATNTPKEKIPYWLHSSNLIASDDTYRTLKVSTVDVVFFARG